MTERLKNEGRLAEKGREKTKLRLIIDGLVESIRDLLDPFEAIEDIKADVAAQQAVALAEKQIRYIELLAEIKALKKALGR